uniref:Uncharacterized protein n=1 Tax=Tanacetum cinerariifolium TaxID=118510 RepID=A0A6L2LL63_TANCI|nr:hypothetical protein [Tanacetum cinerariifolium]
MPNVAMNGTNDKIGENDYEDSNVKLVDDKVLSDSCNSRNKESNENNNDVENDVLSSDCNNGCEEIREKSNNLDNNERVKKHSMEDQGDKVKEKEDQERVYVNGPDAAGKGDGRDGSQMKNSKAEKNYSYVNASLAKNNDVNRNLFEKPTEVDEDGNENRVFNDTIISKGCKRVLVEVPANKCVPDKIKVVYREKDKVKVDYEEANTVDLEKTNSQDKKVDSEG